MSSERDSLLRFSPSVPGVQEPSRLSHLPFLIFVTLIGFGLLVAGCLQYYFTSKLISDLRQEQCTVARADIITEPAKSESRYRARWEVIIKKQSSLIRASIDSRQSFRIAYVKELLEKYKTGGSYTCFASDVPPRGVAYWTMPSTTTEKIQVAMGIILFAACLVLLVLPAVADFVETCRTDRYNDV